MFMKKRMEPAVKRSDVIVVGGGAAGLTCAGYAARRGASVTVVERRERPARKILVTGKGRCNVTNNCTPEEFIRSVRTNPRFLFSAIHAFNCQDVMRWFEDLGVPLKTERGNRVFPVSDNARDIADALTAFALDGGVEMVTGKAAGLLLENGCVMGVRLEDGSCLEAPVVVVATGGMSYPATGSDGSGYSLARQAGHTIVEPRASLVPVECAGDFFSSLMGLSLRNVTLSLYEEGKKKPLFSELGEMLFTHFGVSGPLVLSASSYMRGPAAQYRMTIDLKPGLTAEQLDARILRDFEEQKNRNFQNSLGALLPRTMIPVVVRLSGISPEAKVHQITREDRLRLGRVIKEFSLQPKALRPVTEAVVTSGGVDVRQVDPRTMESKLCSGLYFAGEVLDVDAVTGGFNLQIAFSTGFLAASSLAW